MNSKIAFVFPGQGAQYVGMAMDFVNQNDTLKSILTKFDTDNKTDLFRIMNAGPDEDLKDTRFTQPAILFHSVSAYKTLMEQIDVTPQFVAGHSLGEISSLVANNVISLEEAMYLVHKRGEFMMKANDGKPFAMAAIMGIDSNSVAEVCELASSAGIVIPANFNTPVQTVISGSKAGVERAMVIAKEKGARRAIALKVGGPFHSPLIEKAGGWLAEEMQKLNFKDSVTPVISNVDAKPHTSASDIKENLAKQVTSSVKWIESIEYMISNGVELFVEFGPQKVLCGMIKKIDKNAKFVNIDKVEDIEKAIEVIKEYV
ncbi:MAG: [acyl-carrier-protein] S-malonyltransferase [Candidatus Cloacimonetes bacterium 4572_65]|nr:MAG: [acyl-carrier-protein] S-malonyltransferase [Candidatus Cloacimonetes bacterium 4572_65]